MSSYQIKPNSFAIGSEKDEITALALGAGIAVCLYDEERRAGGMVYTLVPDSTAEGKIAEDEWLKYVDTALALLEEEVVRYGVSRKSMWAKIIGGARIFHFRNQIEDISIGRQNVEAARNWLKSRRIPLRSEDTGNNFGRTVLFFLENGNVEIELANKYKYNI